MSEAWEWVKKRSAEISGNWGPPEMQATAQAWEEWQRNQRVITIRRENMRKAKLAARREQQRIMQAKRQDKRFNGIKGIERVTL